MKRTGMGIVMGMRIVMGMGIVMRMGIVMAMGIIMGIGNGNDVAPETGSGNERSLASGKDSENENGSDDLVKLL